MWKPRRDSPEYRQRRYSPSRPRSPSPPGRYDRDERREPRYESDYPSARRYSPPPRRYSPSPPRRREPEYGYDDRHHDSRRYDDYSSSRRSPPSRYEQEYPGRGRSPIPPPRERDWDRPANMMADRVEQNEWAKPTQNVKSDQWERGVSMDEQPYTYESEKQGVSMSGKQPSQPTKDVIFLHLDPELTEREFMGYLLEEHRADVDSVKIVFDKHTGRSKCFGFANFTSVETAEEFISHNFPHILMPALHAHSEPRKVKIDFSQPISDNATGTVHVRPGSDGTRDIGAAGGGNRVLLLRGLNYHSSGEDLVRRLGQEIARMVGKQGREKEAEATICRIALIVDRETRSKWGFAFVELATSELANALMQYLISPASQPNGFIIADFPVAVSFTNLSTFVPVPAGPLGSEFLLRASRHGGIGAATVDGPDGQWVGYWHEQSGAIETVPKDCLKVKDDGNLEPITTDLRAFLGGLAGPLPGQLGQGSQGTSTAASSGPINISLNDMTAMQPIKIGGVKGKKKEEGFVALPGKNLLGGDDEEEDLGKDSVLLSRTKGIANIIAPSSRKVAKNISKWNTKKTELKAPTEVSSSGKSATGPPAGLSEANAAMGLRQPKASSTSSRPGSPVPFDYTDTSSFASTGKVACLLCQRQFKSEEQLKKHTDLSELHKTNLADAKIRDEGVQRTNAARSKAMVSKAEGWGQGSGAVYRDRAAERRIAHHQPDRPSPTDLGPTSNPLKRKFDAPKAPSPPPPVVQLGEDESNMGNQLLAKMGWKAGSGLGTSGDGRVAPVEVKQFESRVGLGKAQGRDPAKWNGPSGFKTRAYDMAKERYNASDRP